MDDNRKYYFFQFKEDFFTDDTIMILEDDKDGYIYTNILLQMYLLSLKDVGTGKSFVAGCIANALIEKEIPVAMINFGFILADMMNLKN